MAKRSGKAVKRFSRLWAVLRQGQALNQSAENSKINPFVPKFTRSAAGQIVAMKSSHLVQSGVILMLLMPKQKFEKRMTLSLNLLLLGWLSPTWYESGRFCQNSNIVLFCVGNCRLFREQKFTVSANCHKILYIVRNQHPSCKSSLDNSFKAALSDAHGLAVVRDITPVASARKETFCFCVPV